MDFKNKCVILNIIFQTLPQLIYSAGFNDLCPIPELSNDYNYSANGLKLATGLLAPKGTIVSFKCKNNLMLYPAKSIQTVCTDGSWTNEFPQCIRFKSAVESFQPVVLPKRGECGLPTLENGKFISLSTGSELEPGETVPEFLVVQAKCFQDFHSTSSKKYSVCSEGKFEPDLPLCLVTCAPRFSEFVDVECDFNDKKISCTSLTRVPDGTIASMKCKKNLTLPRSASNIARCKNGLWDNDLLPCGSQPPKFKVNRKPPPLQLQPPAYSVNAPPLQPQSPA